MKIFHVYVNKKSKFFQSISLIIIISILSYFIIYSKLNYKIVTNILNIFISTVIPSLFPFILFSNILIYSNYFNIIANTSLSKVIQRLFKVSNFGSSAIIFGFLFGYPNGARYVNELYESKKIGTKEAQYLLMFINNSSPAFILSSIGIGMFGNIKIGALLLISHILAAILSGLILRLKYKLTDSVNVNDEMSTTSDYTLTFDTITKSIIKSIYTLCIIFGFMIIFILANNYILKIFSYFFNINRYFSSFMLGIMEVTSGLKSLVGLPINLKELLVYISFFLGFSSLSINFQIFSCVYKNNFKLKTILKGKIIHGILSAIITYILTSIPKIYEYVNISKTVNFNLYKFTNMDIQNLQIIIPILVCALHIIFLYFVIKKKRLKNRLFKGG